MLIRRWKIVLAVVLTGMIILVVGAVILLNSSLVARKAARILSDKLGARVEIDAVSVGLSGTTVTGVRVFEPGAPPGAVPLLAVQAVEADVSLCSLVTGRITPRSVVIRNPAVRLRFAADGQLATRFPHPSGAGDGGAVPLPAVRVEAASIRVSQDGKPDAALSGIDLQLAAGEEALTLTGCIVDPNWGSWEVRGAAASSFASASVDVRGLTSLLVSTDRIARLPLVDARSIRNYPFQVRVVAGLRLMLEPGRGGLSYRAEAKVEDGTATVTPAELSVARLAGAITIKDGVVALDALSATVAGGTIAGGGTVDLTGDVIRVKLAVAARRLDVTRVPPSWGVKDVVQEGRFSGDATLTLDLPPGGPMRTGGEGRCVVTGARLLGATADGPVELYLRPTGGGFRFGAGPGTAGRSIPERSRDSWLLFLAKRAAGLLLPHLLGEGATEGRVRVRFGLRDVDIASMVQQLRVEVPFPVSGRVSLRVEVDLPINTPDDLAAYRVAGLVDAPSLGLQGVTFQQVKARVAFRDGILNLEELSGILSDPAGAVCRTGLRRRGRTARRR
ncbi:MAG TPA: hypothetical protein VKE74_05265 [Gemmataceae bacterium]|nr:hypothetical protein [Gemmataceae bacterium]